MQKSLLLMVAATVLLAGCKSTKKSEQQAVIETIGGQPVYTSEFAYIYNKNNGSSANAYTRQSLTEYLDLYTNFRLKVMEAESMGMDTSESFKRELEGYKQQLAQPYLTEKSVTDKLIREAYDRMQQEVNASHILLQLSPDAAPKDTLEVYNRIIEIRKRAMAGEDFGKLAQQHSEDPSAKDNKGNLGYFTALQMVYPFEDAAYKTEPGQLSMPVRTRFGYHLIKVHEKRPAQGEIKVSHIMVRAQPGIPAADSVAAKQKIDEIYRRVQQKEDWQKLVSQFSEDQGSVNKGGELPWFGTGRMIPAFEDAAFALKNKGDVSAPVKTPYGWHIIKLDERRSLPAFEEMEANLRNKVAKDSRSELNKAAFLKRVRQENKFEENQKGKELIFAKTDSTLLQRSWNPTLTDKEKSTTLFSIQNKNYTVGDFVNYIKTNHRAVKSASPEHAIRLNYDNFVESSLINYEKENLENKYIDYRMLVKEYRDGILLFQLMDQKVWSKAIEDTVGLKAFFEANKENYKWDTRAQATIISAANPELLKTVQQKLEEGTFKSQSVRIADISFNVGKSALNNEAPENLDSNAGSLQELTNRLAADTTLTVELVGHADTREGRNARTLATQRAKAVQKHLIDNNIAANRIKVANGQTASGKTAAARAQNRGVSFVLSSESLAFLQETMNQNDPLAVQIAQRKFQKGDHKVLDSVTWEEGTYTKEQNGRAYLIKIEKIIPPTYKTLDEARGVATSDYQVFLEKEWVKDLRNRYPVQVNQNEVDKLVKK